MEERRDRRQYDARLKLIDARIKRLEWYIYGLMGMLVALNVLWAIAEMGIMYR